LSGLKRISKRLKMKLRIGSRRSKLALWQAETIAERLNRHHIETEIIEIVSFGDTDQTRPIQKLGDKGVFTKALDDALLAGEIDLAVHSLKDVPTDLHPGLQLSAVPERGNPLDVLVKPKKTGSDGTPRTIATGSIRRKAFWKNKYPQDEVTGLRGNVPTRLQKVEDNNWYGAIFAYAGLERLNLSNRISEVLDWMISAPSQGAMGIITKKETESHEIVQKLDDPLTHRCVAIERAFMNELEAGCSSPVGGYARAKDDQIHFKGAVLSVDGQNRIDIKKHIPLRSADARFGTEWAVEIKKQGAAELLKASH